MVLAADSFGGSLNSGLRSFPLQSAEDDSDSD